jgi:hypothetical protein
MQASVKAVPPYSQAMMTALLVSLVLPLVRMVAAAPDTTPVHDMLGSIIGAPAASRFDLSVVAAVVSSCASPVGECTRLADAPGAPGRVAIQGTSLSSLSFGVGVYLQERCNVTLTWIKTGGYGDAAARCGNPVSLPRVGAPITRTRSMQWTYYQNVVDASYSYAWWDWARWELEITWMALRGVNLALMYTGQELVLKQLYSSHGVNLSAATGSAAFYNGPAWLSWSRGQRAADVGGLDVFTNQTERGSLPDWWIDSQATLGKQQAQRMRALGITTILRGFEGNVPGGLKLKYPKANISATKAGPTGQAWQLDALDPLFATLADQYMRVRSSSSRMNHSCVSPRVSRDGAVFAADPRH